MKKKKNKPLDPEKDIDQPVRKKPEQGKLNIHVETREPEKLVRNRRMLVTYVKPHFDRNKKGHRYVALEVSQVLSPEHDGLLAKPIADAYNDIAKKNRKRVDLINIKQQAAKFYTTYDDSNPSLEILAAKVTHVSLQVIEEKGTGKANKVIRLSFRLRVPLSRDVAHFSEWTFGDAYWLRMQEAQGNLLEEEEEEVEQEEEETVDTGDPVGGTDPDEDNPPADEQAAATQP